MRSSLPILTQRFDFLANCVYNIFNYNALAEAITREVYSRSVPKTQVLSDTAVWKTHIRRVEALLNDVEVEWFKIQEEVGYEYDDVGGPWEIVARVKLPIKAEERLSFVEMVSNELKAYKAIILAIEEYLKQIELAERVGTVVGDGSQVHSTFEYIHFNRTPNNLKTLFRDLVGKEFISRDTTEEDFIANFSGKEQNMPPIIWIADSLASLRDFIQLLIDGELLTKMKRGQPARLAEVCFSYPAKPGIMKKLWKQPKYQSKELSLLKLIIQNFKKLSPPIYTSIK